MAAKLAQSPERTAIIAKALPEWLAVGRSTAPADFAAAEAAITSLYAAIDKPRPHFVRLSSPLGAELYINLLRQTWPKAYSKDQLWDQLWDQLGDQLGDQLRDQLRGQLRDQLRGQLRDQLRDQLRGQLRDQLWGQLWDQLWDQLGDQLRDQLRDQLGDQLEKSKLSFIGTWFWGAWDYYWMYLDAGRRLGAVYPAREAAMLDAHLTVARSIGWWYPFNDFCILTDRPEILAVNELGRLHGDDGPAIQYRDGYAQWFLNGLPVDRRIVETPEALTAAEVKNEPNAEVRRHMLDRYGGLRGSAAMGRWLTDIGAEPISSVDITAKMQPSGLSIWRLSNGEAPVLCKLYRATLPDDEPLHLLFVVCTSTAKEVFLRVPPSITDAGQARDWTFGESLAEAVET